MPRYNVTIVRYGHLAIEADSECETMLIADRQNTETVNWSDDWMPTDCDEDPDLTSEECIRAKVFE